MKKRKNFKVQKPLDLPFPEDRIQHLHTLRQKAYKAMQMLQEFSPKLTGMVLDGSATLYTHIRLHVFTSPEEVIIYLVNHNIPYDEGEQRVQLLNKQFVSLPMFCFYLAGTAIEITVFPENSAKYMPRCPITGERIPRADLQEVGSLLSLVR